MGSLAIRLRLILPEKRLRGTMLRGAIPWLYLLPVIAPLILWVYAPLGEAGWLSFFEWDMLPDSAKRYVGFANYRNLLALPKLWQAVGNTVIYMLGLLPFAVLIPFAIAIYTQDLPARFRNIYRVLIFVPMIIAPVVAAAVWRWLLDPGHGLVNQALIGMGFQTIRFLNDPHVAIWTIIFITGWKLIGFATLIAAAANAAIDPSLIEAAKLDGAGPWAVIRRVRLPLLASTAMLLVTMSLLLGAQWSFAYINALTEGGPLGSTINIYYLLWDFGFSSGAVGWSAASAVLLFVAFALLALGLIRLSNRLSFHDN
jgi:multiple sugar transport system permease protein